jgi:tetratricopeptide (TPR) repeat protein
LLRSLSEEPNPWAFCELALTIGTVWAIAQRWTDGLEVLEPARTVAEHYGWQARRARLCAHLTRFLGWKERFDDAEARYEEGRRIADRLSLEAVSAELDTARGAALVERALVERDQVAIATRAVALLRPAAQFFATTGRLALQTRAAIDLARAAGVADSEAAYNEAVQLLDDVQPGYIPLLHLTLGEVANWQGDVEQARANLELAIDAAGQTGIPVIADLAKRYEAGLKQRGS